MEYDKSLIEASFAMQYGIRLRHEKDMTLGEFYALLRGIMPETPLGKIVAVRSEKNKDILSKFSEGEKKIRQEWNKFLMGKKENIENIENSGEKRLEKRLESKIQWEKEINNLQNMLKELF